LARPPIRNEKAVREASENPAATCGDGDSQFCQFHLGTLKGNIGRFAKLLRGSQGIGPSFLLLEDWESRRRDRLSVSTRITKACGATWWAIGRPTLT